MKENINNNLYYIPNSKVANTFDVLSIPQNTFKIKTGNEEFALVELAFKNPNVQYSNALEGIDKAVHCAVITLYYYGHRDITAKMVYRLLTGLNKDSGIGKGENCLLQAIENSIEKQMYTQVKINFENDSISKSKKSKCEKMRIESYLICAEITEKYDDDAVMNFHLYDQSPLYRYSELKNQVISVPKDLLEDKRINVKASERKIIVRNEIIKRISVIKNDKNNFHGNYLRYDYLLEKIGQENMSKASYFKFRKMVMGILDNLIEKKYITGYTEYKDLNKYVGVRFEF